MGPHGKKTGGIWEQGDQEKKLLGEISSGSQKHMQARKNVEYYINTVFPLLYGICFATGG